MKFFISWNEIEFTATRSSGAGGQHVNRTNSAVQLRFSISQSSLPEEIKQRLLFKLKNKLVQEDQILIRCEEERDQKQNKETAYRLLNAMIHKALQEPKKRVPTKPKKSAVKKRLESKKIHSDKKRSRSEKIKW